MVIKDYLKISAIPVLIASLCCLGPLILVLFGVSTVSLATSLTNNLYGNYKWLFRLIGLISLLLSLILYFRSKGICTLDQVKRQRNKIINITLISIIIAIISYLIWLYVVVHYWGVFLKIW